MSEAAGQVVKQWDPFWGTRAIKTITSGIESAGTSLQSGTAGLSKASITQSKRYTGIIEKEIGGVLGGLVGNINRGNDLIIGSLGGFSDTIRKNTEPFSDFMTSTLGTLTGVIRDPLGSNGLGNVLTNLLNNVSPGYGDQVNGTITNLNLQAIANLPSQIFSSVDHLITAVDNILAIPLSFLAEVYYGFIAIIESISKLISNVINGFIELLFDFLDSIIPIKSILALLDAVAGLANQIGGIANTFLGANVISGFTTQITNFTSQIGNILNNPLDLVFSIVPEQVSQVLYVAQNPQQLINQFLPPQLSEAFSKISSMTGFGFNGNMGYGFQSVLQGLQGGVIRSVLTNYAAQYDVLAPIIAGQGNGLLNARQASVGFNPQLIQERYNRSYVDDTARSLPSQYSVTPGGP
jgi:hypothetical protein